HTLGDSPDDPQYVKTELKRGYRFIAEVTDDGDRTSELVGKSTANLYRRYMWAASASVVLLATGWFFYSHRQIKLTDKDTVVLADFVNKTGDPIFDDTLKTVLGIALRESPFLSLLSEDRIHETLTQMTRPVDTPLTAGVAREVCQRTRS